MDVGGAISDDSWVTTGDKNGTSIHPPISGKDRAIFTMTLLLNQQQGQVGRFDSALIQLLQVV
jgi:hypothetical protein